MGQARIMQIGMISISNTSQVCGVNGGAVEFRSTRWRQLQLNGVGVAAALRCRYCSLFHTEAAKMFGATDAEIKDALLVAKDIAGWSTYLNGLRYDEDVFRRELEEVGWFLSGKGAKELVGGVKR